MITLSEITKQRWFMKKASPAKDLKQIDSVTIQNVQLSLIQISFSDGTDSIYALLEKDSDNSWNDFFKTIFPIAPPSIQQTSYAVTFAGQFGDFIFEQKPSFVKQNTPDFFKTIHPVLTEQSNSSFVQDGTCFFKLFRRLEQGFHPESETLSFLDEQKFYVAPHLFGICFYRPRALKPNPNNDFLFAILEEHIPKSCTCWDIFAKFDSPILAKQLGIQIAAMHRALQNLKGVQASTTYESEIPFNKLQALLQTEITNHSSHASDCQTLLENLEPLRKHVQSLFQNATTFWHTQRIHGDLHLGQILYPHQTFCKINKSNDCKIIDFEGEPSRTLSFRRRLQSPAIDLAGMIRSFRYASFVRQNASRQHANTSSQFSETEIAFLTGYATKQNIEITNLQTALQPYILAKCVYETCYELEYRPNWFHIPASALLAEIQQYI